MSVAKAHLLAAIEEAGGGEAGSFSLESVVMPALARQAARSCWSR